MNESRNRILARWIDALRIGDIPDDVRAQTRLRVLDNLGLILLAARGAFGARMRTATAALGRGDEATLIGLGARSTAALAALANGALAEATQFDDTHNETIIHPTSPTLAATLAVCEARGASGAELMTALIGATEITCRIGLVAPGQFHGRGFHPTAIAGTFGAAYGAGKLLGLDADALARAAGIAGSMASGSLECWRDGTEAQFIHPGWAAHAGISAAGLAGAGFSGPDAIFEGRLGLFASHVQAADYAFAWERMTADLGAEWACRDVSLKPYPAAHIMHAFIDAILYLYHEEGLRAEQVARIRVPAAAYMIGVVAEPRAEKVPPRNDVVARVSLPYTLAEALSRGRLAGDAYAPETVNDARVLALAEKITVEVDPDAPGSERYKGWVVVETTDGRTLERIEEHNWGSREKPMTAADVAAKFRDNAVASLGERGCEALARAVMSLETLPDLERLIESTRGRSSPG